MMDIFSQTEACSFKEKYLTLEAAAICFPATDTRLLQNMKCILLQNMKYVY